MKSVHMSLVALSSQTYKHYINTISVSFKASPHQVWWLRHVGPTYVHASNLRPHRPEAQIDHRTTKIDRISGSSEFTCVY